MFVWGVDVHDCMYVYIYTNISKMTNRSQGRPKVSLFNNY